MIQHLAMRLGNARIYCFGTMVFLGLACCLGYRAIVLLEVEYEISSERRMMKAPVVTFLSDVEKEYLHRMEFDWSIPSSTPLGYDKVINASKGIVLRSRLDANGSNTKTEVIHVEPEVIGGYAKIAIKRLNAVRRRK